MRKPRRRRFDNGQGAMTCAVLPSRKMIAVGPYWFRVKDIRALAAWLLKAADWLEGEKTNGN